jgi:hypothetical protein
LIYKQFLLFFANKIDGDGKSRRRHAQ